VTPVQAAGLSSRAAPPPATTAGPVRRLRIATAVLVVLGVALLLAGAHLTQGTSDVGARDLVDLVLGRGTDRAADVAVASRLPRMLAGVLVGIALGAAGAALQSVARNALAAPDTLAVNAGAFLAMTVVAAFGLSLPALLANGVAFVGGLLAAALVLLLASGGGAGPTRLVLAGSAIAIALASLTSVLILLKPYETKGLFAWGSGSLAQIGLGAVQQTAPVAVAALTCLLLLAKRLDLLALGDDAATVLGIDVRRTRAVTVVAAVLLAAVAVTVAGPIGFVGLCAPALVRLVAPLVPGLLHHRVLLPLSALSGVVVVLAAEVTLRGLVGARRAVEVPTGVVTSLLGAVFLVALAARFRDSGPTRQAPSAHSTRLRSRTGFAAVLVVCAVGAVSAAVGAVLVGDRMLLLGDVTNWLAGRAGTGVTFVLDTRVPRVVAAFAAGTALALAGATIQAVCRNPLAEPAVVGVAQGAGVGVVLLITLVPLAGAWAMAGAGLLGALTATLLVLGVTVARGGLSTDRLLLVGVGVSAGALAVITLLIVLTDPWNETKALTWLAGSTYGRTFQHLLPVLTCLAVVFPLLVGNRRRLDLLALDDDTPQVLGVRLAPARLLLLGTAAALTATAVTAVGLIGFVGLVAPHAARALVGGRHARVLPVAALLGAVLVSLGDTVGRTVLAPAQLPAGLLTAVIGAPYFVWLLWRSRVA
jgi:iron complex transport system permease protein